MNRKGRTGLPGYRNRNGPTGGATGMAVDEPGTNGRLWGTSGKALLPHLVIAAVALGVVAQVSINALSRIADTKAAGRPMASAVAWGTELTSGVAILILLYGLWWVIGRLDPLRIGWPRAILGHVAASFLFSVLHVGLMSVMRYALWGADYLPVTGPDALLYEYRKDSWTYVLLVTILALGRWIVVSRSRLSVPSPNAPRLLLVQDGARQFHVPVDAIDHVEAAGNYVELDTDGRRLLHRATLAAVETELGDGFIRIHRSRIVNRGAIRRIESNQSGDFLVETAGGATLKGSRRYRAALRGQDQN